MFRPVPLSSPTESQDFVGVSLSPRDKTHSFLGPLTSATAVTGPHPVPRRCPERPTTARCIGPGRRIDSALRRVRTVVAHPRTRISLRFFLRFLLF